MAEATRTNRKVTHGKLPTKRSINLVQVTAEKPINWAIAIPAIIAIVAAAVLISKFAVVDRIADMNRANSELASIRNQLQEGYDKIESYGELTDQYAHYTFSGMTEDEVSRVDRVEVINLIQRNTIPGVTVSNWSLSGNQLTLNLSGASLQQVNQMAKSLNAEDLVSYTNVNTAQKANEEDVVTANIVIVLNNESQGGAAQ